VSHFNLDTQISAATPLKKNVSYKNCGDQGEPLNSDRDIDLGGKDHFKVNIVFQIRTFLTPEMKNTKIFIFK